MRALKIFVVVLGVILVVGFAALIAVIAVRVAHRRTEPAAHHVAPTTALEIPRGARIEAMTATPDRLILDLILPDGNRQIVLIDLATGARLGMIELRPQK